MMGARDSVVFYLNGRRREVRGAEALLTLSDFLREQCGLVGTKIVCSEGDCGSCTVLVGRPNGDALTYRPLDSCILFVFQIDGAHVVTVEGLAASGGLTPAQDAMVQCHGSQCGFCTPGFVMAMTGLAEETRGAERNDQSWREGLTGNLCRCTGYVPILDACHQTSKAEWQSLDGCFPPDEILAASAELSGQSIAIEADQDGKAVRLYSPATIEDAIRFRGEHPACTVVAGATDLGVQRNKGRLSPQVYLDLNRISLLEGHEVCEDESGRVLVAGARASWTDLLETCRTELPEFAKILSVFGSPQIRHAGTVGGNIINASPIADSLPLLFVLDAKLRLESLSAPRTVPIAEFYRGYKQLDLGTDELLTRVEIPLPREGELLRLYKVSRRRDLDISTFTAAILMRLEGETIAEARLAYGAVGPTVVRLPDTEEFLLGKLFEEETLRTAGDYAVKEITPITDVRGAADYRFQLARNVLLKFYAEHQAGVLV